MALENYDTTLELPAEIAAELNVDPLVGIESDGASFHTYFEHLEYGEQVWDSEPSSPSDQAVTLEFLERDPQAFAVSSIESYLDWREDEEDEEDEEDDPE